MSEKSIETVKFNDSIRFSSSETLDANMHYFRITGSAPQLDLSFLVSFFLKKRKKKEK